MPPVTSLVALRDRREQVIATLTESFAHDLVDVDEFDRRIGLAHRATALAELDELVKDLVPASSTALVPTPSEQALAEWPTERTMRAILGNVDKKGRWSVAKKLNVTSFLGGGTLDFREAQFAPGVTELHVTAILGGLVVIVPPWLAVECDATSVLGGFEELDRGHGSPDPGRAMLRISGFALLGDVSIETRLLGESRRQAKKRVKKERKERKKLASSERRSLPSGDD